MNGGSASSVMSVDAAKHRTDSLIFDRMPRKGSSSQVHRYTGCFLSVVRISHKYSCENSASLRSIRSFCLQIYSDVDGTFVCVIRSTVGRPTSAGLIRAARTLGGAQPIFHIKTYHCSDARLSSVTLPCTSSSPQSVSRAWCGESELQFNLSLLGK